MRRQSSNDTVLSSAQVLQLLPASYAISEPAETPEIHVSGTIGTNK